MTVSSLKKWVLSAWLAVSGGFFSFGEEYKDVRQMGDIWVVTVDKSGSMLNKTTPAAVAEGVYARLIEGECLASADFGKDRFLFLTSGFKFYDQNRLGKELKNAKAFDKSFIHPTDGVLHSFADKRACAEHIRSILQKNNYSYNLSFVSQIRLFSIVHAVNLLKSIGETDTYDGFKVLTITDDADQNDQWMMDYRNLKIWAPTKVQEVNDSTSKYIYNVLNGRGKGMLEELFSDERRTPHLWVYQYRSKQQDVPEIEWDMLSVEAADGRRIRTEPKVETIQGDTVCFFHIDSIGINGAYIPVDESFREAFGKECEFDNSFRRNRTEVRGFAQVEYDDEIFGKHYRIVPFVEHDVVLSEKLGKLLGVLALLLGLALLGFLIYFFLIRPNRVLFTVHSPLGRVMSIKRGFASHWKGDYIPVECFQENEEGIFGVIVKKHRDIKSDWVCPTESESPEILITSRYPISLSVKAVSHSTADNIEGLYYFRSLDYSPLLREQYEKTLFHALYRDHLTSRWKWMQHCIKWIIDAFNLVAKRYYYVIEDITEQDCIYVSHDPLLKGKRFIIEYYRVTGQEPDQGVPGDIVQKALTYYYENETPRYDLVLCTSKKEEGIDWVLVSIDNHLVTRGSLRQVTSLVRFRQTEIKEPLSVTAKRILQALEKELPNKRIGFFDTSSFEFQHPLSFSIKESTAPGFISFMESTAKLRSQALYSPIKDTDVEEKFIRLRPTLQSGHLFLSPIPIRYLTEGDPLLKRVSLALVKTEEKQPSVLRLCGTHLEFRDIIESF